MFSENLFFQFSVVFGLLNMVLCTYKHYTPVNNTIVTLHTAVYSWNLWAFGIPQCG